MRPIMCSRHLRNCWRFVARTHSTTTMRFSRGASMRRGRLPMRMPELGWATLIAVGLGLSAPACAQNPYGIGRTATAAEIAGWNIDIGRDMPQNAPQSLSNDDVYAVSAYILHLNGLLPADATLDARALSAIKMPNRGMFTRDPRPDVKNPACVTGC